MDKSSSSSKSTSSHSNTSRIHDVEEVEKQVKGKKYGARILDSDEEEQATAIKPTRRVAADPLGIWSDDEEVAKIQEVDPDDSANEKRTEDEDEDEEQSDTDGESSTESDDSLHGVRARIERSPEIPGPASLEKMAKSSNDGESSFDSDVSLNGMPARITRSPEIPGPPSLEKMAKSSSKPNMQKEIRATDIREKSIIELSDDDSDDELVKFPVPKTTKPAAPAQPKFPVPQPYQQQRPPPYEPVPIRNHNQEYKNEHFKPPSKVPTAPKVQFLSYNDPILQKQNQSTYVRPEVNPNGLKPALGKPINVPSNDATAGAVEQFAQLNLVDDPFEPRYTQAQVEEQLKELVGHALEEEVDGEFDEDEKVVEGFEPGFELLDHQVIARRWMRDRETGVKVGGILADDMGLGKTIQMLARISDGLPSKEDRRAGWAKSTLVVCPVGLMDQWEREIAKFAPWMKVVQHHGAARASNPAVLERNHVVITSYNIVSNEYAIFEPSASKTTKSKATTTKKKAKDDFLADDDEEDEFSSYFSKRKAATTKKSKKLCALFEVQWWRVVLDEAHNIKNKATKMSIACCQLPGKYRWALTGTPLQNNVEELFPLLKFLHIRPLNDWSEYKKAIVDPVKKGRTKGAMKRLHVVLKAIMLRRTKTAVINGKPILELPARNVQVVECEFDEDERAFYDALASKVALTFNKYMRAGEIMKNYTSVLTLLLRLRQACNHPTLVSKDFSVDADALESTPVNKDDDSGLTAALEGLTVNSRSNCQVCFIELTESNRSKNTARCGSCERTVAVETRRKSVGRGGSSLPQNSAKIRKITELLFNVLDKEDIEGEAPEKVIIFSQFTSFLNILEPFLIDEQIKFVRVDGSMLPQDRAKAVEKIKRSRSTRVILISFKAGSTGLNLTCCNHVILTDLWWNPALEDQAFDRAHRMGQKRDVEIYKLTVPQTVEERILQLQDGKRQLAAAALSGDKFKSGNKLRLEDIVKLFNGDARGDSDED